MNVPLSRPLTFDSAENLEFARSRSAVAGGEVRDLPVHVLLGTPDARGLTETGAGRCLGVVA